MYAYDANNPIRYLSKRLLSNSEKAYINVILGEIGKQATSNAKVIAIPQDRAASTPLFYSKQIWLPSNIYGDALSTYEGKNTLIHESFHQVQYYLEPGGFTMVRGPSAFQTLIFEQGLYSLGKVNVYSYGDYR